MVKLLRLTIETLFLRQRQTTIPEEGILDFRKLF